MSKETNTYCDSQILDLYLDRISFSNSWMDYWYILGFFLYVTSRRLIWLTWWDSLFYRLTFEMPCLFSQSKVCARLGRWKGLPCFLLWYEPRLSNIYQAIYLQYLPVGFWIRSYHGSGWHFDSSALLAVVWNFVELVPEERKFWTVRWQTIAIVNFFVDTGK